MDLKDLRAEIDKIDDELVRLFCQRMDVAAQIADYKKANDLPIYVPSREREKLMDVAKKAYPKFQEKLEICQNLFYGYDYSDFYDGSDLQRGKTITGAVNFIMSVEKEEEKQCFIKEALMLKQSLSLCSSMVKEKMRMEAAFFESVRLTIA